MKNANGDKNPNDLPESEYITLGRKIKLIRQTEGITQLGLSEITGIKNYNISNYERDKLIPNKNNLFKIAQALKINPDFLNPYICNSTSKVIHMLLDIEKLYNIEILPVNLNENHSVMFSIIFNDERLQKLIGEWYKKKINIVTPGDTEEYLRWQMHLK